MFERKSLKWPITLAVLMIVLLIGLAVGWILLSVYGAMASAKTAGVYWVLLSIGSAFFVCLLVGVVLYLVLSIQQINVTRRQSNFIDSVTHELKSPIASLKLYLQTLNRREMDQDQRHTFYSSMLDDVDRLDQLINHLLDVARLESLEKIEIEKEWIRLDTLLSEIASDLAGRYSLKADQIRLQSVPLQISGRRSDLDILCRNLIDNAIKYGGDPPQVDIELTGVDSKKSALLTVCDNGSGIPRKMRRRVFGRFFRIGSELERKKPGTGLGLFLVRTILRQFRGKITILDRPGQPGTKFEVQLPGIQRLENQSGIGSDPKDKVQNSNWEDK
jgi:signal transduction histidine kinase